MTVLAALTRIVQQVVEAESTAQQVDVIVDSIEAQMDVDACSLYLSDTTGTMTLAASHGLSKAAVGRVQLPAGKGLVGLIARSRHPLNVADASTHPDFHYIEETEEHRFRSFAGVPLVRAGRVIGVLTAQCQRPRELAEEEQAFLVTLGAQLALVLTDEAVEDLLRLPATHTFRGVRGAPGIGIGETCLCADVDLYSVPDAPCEDPDAAVVEWRELVSRVREDVRGEQQRLGSALSGEVAAIFEAYQMMLADPGLVAGVEQAIHNGHCLPYALRTVIHHFSSLFLAMEDPYLRARHEDIHQLGNKLYSAWRGAHADNPLPGSAGRIVLVGDQVTISDIASIPRERLAGVVCFRGSSLSHTAVLANALGVPAVMGIGEHRGLADRQACIVDGNSALVFFEPDAGVRREYRQLELAEQQLRGELAALRDLPAVTLDGHGIQLYANSGLLADISPGLAAGAEGLGLYRTEIPFMVSQAFPSEEEQFALYRQVLESYRGKPVSMRILDIGGDKPLPYFPINEENPALGWRGIRFCLDNSSLLMTQVRAMLRAAAGLGNLRILLPMVSSASELAGFQDILEDAIAQLRAEGLTVGRPEVGVMVEVPAAISQLHQWRERIDFVSIGTNDLSQYLLAVDRNNPRVSSLYDPLHPAVLSEIDRVIRISAANALPLSVCGEMASDPAAALLLIGMGVETLSMSAAHLPRIKWLLRRVNREDAALLVREVLGMRNVAEIRAAVTDRMGELGLGDLIPSATH
jgi:phosphotransferase system enzyme I (PtsI)/phosphotransferase system enzyme I (PtsP)